MDYYIVNYVVFGQNYYGMIAKYAIMFHFDKRIERVKMTYQKYRIDLDDAEMHQLKALINSSKMELSASLKVKINSPKIIKITDNKREATSLANEKRTAVAKQKIKDAVQQMELDLKRGFIKKITYYGISKKSGVHIDTVKKYHFV